MLDLVLQDFNCSAADLWRRVGLRGHAMALEGYTELMMMMMVYCIAIILGLLIIYNNLIVK